MSQISTGRTCCCLALYPPPLPPPAPLPAPLKLAEAEAPPYENIYRGCGCQANAAATAAASGMDTAEAADAEPDHGRRAVAADCVQIPARSAYTCTIHSPHRTPLTRSLTRARQVWLIRYALFVASAACVTDHC